MRTKCWISRPTGNNDFRKLVGSILDESLLFLMNQWLMDWQIPETWKNAEVLLYTINGRYRKLPTNQFTTSHVTDFIKNYNKSVNNKNAFIPVNWTILGNTFDSIQTWAFMATLDDARIDSRYTTTIRDIYRYDSFHTKIGEETKIEKICLETGEQKPLPNCSHWKTHLNK